MTNSNMDKILKKMAVGAVAFLALFIMECYINNNYSELVDFIKLAVGGTLLSSLFLVPVFRMLLKGKFEVKDKLSLLLGILLAIAYTFFLSVLGVVILILKWMVIYALISVLVHLFEKSIEEAVEW